MSPTSCESVAKAIIVNEQHKALILTIGEHTTNPERSFTADLPGGMVDIGESERDAVLREIQEETNIT